MLNFRFYWEKKEEDLSTSFDFNWFVCSVVTHTHTCIDILLFLSPPVISIYFNYKRCIFANKPQNIIIRVFSVYHTFITSILFWSLFEIIVWMCDCILIFDCHLNGSRVMRLKLKFILAYGVESYNKNE